MKNRAGLETRAGGRLMVPTSLLIVDDEISFLDVMKKRLSKRLFNIMTAQSGQEALETLSRHSDIEVVVLDIKMPGMSGIQTLKEIKRRYPLVEVMLLSGDALFDSVIEGMRLGAFDHLAKPCDLEELTAKIERAAARRMRLTETLTETDPRAS